MPNQATGGGLMSTPIFPLALMFLVIYFLIIRPQKKQQKDRKNMLSGVSKNDQVVTVGGIHGTVVLIKESSIVVRVDDNIKIEFDKESINKIIRNKKSESKSSS